MKMRKLLSVAVVSVLTMIMLTGCGEKKDTLKIGMEIGYPPFEYFDTDGTTAIGVDVELADALADEMGIEVEIIDTAWAGIFAGLEKGDYDCIISAVTITPERLLDFEFSEPYIQNFQCIVSLVDGEIKPTDPSECASIKLGYQEETTSDIFITDYADAEGMEFEPFEYAKVMDCFTDLELGRLDAVICDSTVAASYVGEGSIYEITWIQDADAEAEEFGVCIQKGNTELVEKVNKALATLKENGKLDEILAKYF